MTDKTDRELLEDMSVNLATLTENGVKVKSFVKGGDKK